MSPQIWMRKSVLVSVAVAVLLLLLLILAIGPAYAGAVDLSNNLSQPKSSARAPSALFWAAQEFTPTINNYYISDVKVPLCKLVAFDTTTYSVQFYSVGAENKPGTKVADVTTNASAYSLAAYSPSSPCFPVDFPLNPRIALSPNTPYYLVVHVNDASGRLAWDYTESTSGTGFPAGWAISSDGGSSWPAPSQTDPLQMQITADSSPAAVALSSLRARTVPFDLAAWVAHLFK